MNITYSVSLKHEAATVTTAKCQLPLYGRWVELSITSYCIFDGYHHSTALTFGLRNLPNRLLKCSSADASNNGDVLLARGDGGNRQEFVQHVSAPMLAGQLLDYSDLTNGGVPAGRTVTQSVMRRMESIVETMRQHIRKHLSRDVRDFALTSIEKRYGELTRKTLTILLGAINWRLMFRNSGCDDEQANVIDYAMAHNPLRFHNIVDDDSTEIPLLAEVPVDRVRVARPVHHPVDSLDAVATAIANQKALSLLKTVCGEVLADEFARTGKITVEHYGYKFEIAPWEWVRCTDPNGRTARLCIHTEGFSCNAIDEVIIAYLHLKFQFVQYMKLAIVHGAESGFMRLPKVFLDIAA